MNENTLKPISKTIERYFTCRKCGKSFPVYQNGECAKCIDNDTVPELQKLSVTGLVNTIENSVIELRSRLGIDD